MFVHGITFLNSQLYKILPGCIKWTSSSICLGFLLNSVILCKLRWTVVWDLGTMELCNGHFE